MEKAISAAEANRRFSELLRTVRKGKTVVVTSHGKPVARIVPMTDRDQTERAAHVALFARLLRDQSHRFHTVQFTYLSDPCGTDLDLFLATHTR